MIIVFEAASLLSFSIASSPVTALVAVSTAD
jgi:hypothetical protein